MESTNGNNNDAITDDTAEEDDEMTAIVNDYRAYMTNEPRTSIEEVDSDSDSDGESEGEDLADTRSGREGRRGMRMEFSGDSASDIDGMKVTWANDHSSRSTLVAPASLRPSPLKVTTHEEEELASSFALATTLSEEMDNEHMPMLPPPALPPRSSSPSKVQHPRPAFSRQVRFNSPPSQSRYTVHLPPVSPMVTLEPFGLSAQARFALRAHSKRLPQISRHSDQLIVMPKGFYASYYDWGALGTPIVPGETGFLDTPFSKSQIISLRSIGRKMPLTFWIERDSASGERYWLWHVNGHRSSLRIENRNQLNTWVSQRPAVLNQRAKEFEKRASGRRGGRVKSMDAGTMPVKKMGRDFLKWGSMVQKELGAGVGIQLPARLCVEKMYSLFIGSSGEGILPNDIMPTYRSDNGSWCLCTKKGGNWQPVSKQVGMRRVGGEWPGIARIFEQVDNLSPEPVNIGDHEHFVSTGDRQHFLNAADHQNSQNHSSATSDAPPLQEPHQEQHAGNRVYIHDEPLKEDMVINVEKNFPNTHQVDNNVLRALSPELGATSTSAEASTSAGNVADSSGVAFATIMKLAKCLLGENEETEMSPEGTAPGSEAHPTTESSDQAWDDGTMTSAEATKSARDGIHPAVAAFAALFKIVNHSHGEKGEEGAASELETHTTTPSQDQAQDNGTINRLEFPQQDDDNRHHGGHDEAARVTFAPPAHRNNGNGHYADDEGDLWIPDDDDDDDDGDTVIGDGIHIAPWHVDREQKIVGIVRRFRGDLPLRIVLGRKYYWRAWAEKYGQGRFARYAMSDYCD